MTGRKTFRIAVRKFGPFESAIQKQWDSFNSFGQTGLTLEAVAFDLQPLSKSLFDHEGLVRGDWDVAFLDTDWLAHAHASKALLNLAPYVKAAPPSDFPHGWSDSLLRLQSIEGEILGLPYHDGPECLIYRKDLFDDPREQRAYEGRFGEKLRVPQTWTEFRRVASFFQRPQEKLFGTAVAAYPDGHNSVYDFLLQLWTRGGELVDDAGEFHVDTAQAVEALEFYRDILQDASVVHPRCAEMDSVKCGLAFVKGEIAMMVNWFGFAAMAETIENSRVRGKVDIAAIPRADGCASCSLNVYWVLAIAAGSPHREAAYQFLRHAISPAMDKLLTLEGAVGCRKSTWGDADVNRMVPFYNRLDDLHAHARELPRLVEWPEIASVIDRMIVKATGTRDSAQKIAGEAQRELNHVSSPKPTIL
ncbi:MAG: extracellular solute-binding protein [Candidatus Acidiferrales bacterium]